MRPLTITACSLYTAVGRGVEAHREALAGGVSGLAAPSFALPFETFVGEITAALAPLPDALSAQDTRLTRIAAALVADVADAVGAARDRWGARRVGVFLGTSTAGILCSEAAWMHQREHGVMPEAYDFLAQHTYAPLVDVVRALTGLEGPGWVVSTACSSSAKVFGTAQRLIAADLIDAALVGGVDTLCQTTLRGFNGLGVTSSARCTPFAADRAGINIGEGGGLALLERDGDGPRLLGVGESADAHHISAPHPTGAGAELAMRAAVQAAGLTVDAVDFINAHGTGTALNDAAESAAITRVFGAVPMVSTKAQTGHLLGGCGIAEALLAVIALQDGRVGPSLGAEPVDPELAANVLTVPLTGELSVAVSNTFAFGGNNVSLVLGR